MTTRNQKRTETSTTKSAPFAHHSNPAFRVHSHPSQTLTDAEVHRALLAKHEAEHKATLEHRHPYGLANTIRILNINDATGSDHKEETSGFAS